MFDRITIWIATGGYSGYLPVVPGTVGSILGLMLYLPIARSPISLQVALTGTLIALAVWTSGRAEELMGTKDPRCVVIDEIAGMWLTLLFIPHEVGYMLAGFVVFRLFDVVKPPPANHLQRLSGGWGITMDDIIAGLYANAVLQVVHAIQ